MINFYLRLKSWQLFLISWGPLMLLVGQLTLDRIRHDASLFYYFPISLCLFLMGSFNAFAWIYSIGITLERNSVSARMQNKVLFNILFWIPATFFWGVVAFLLFNLFVRKVTSGNPELEFKVIVALFYLSVFSALAGLGYCARAIRKVELQRAPFLKEYILDFITLVFAPIGIWVLQPRLNKLVNSRRET